MQRLFGFLVAAGSSRAVLPRFLPCTLCIFLDVPYTSQSLLAAFVGLPLVSPFFVAFRLLSTWLPSAVDGLSAPSTQIRSMGVVKSSGGHYT